MSEYLIKIKGIQGLDDNTDTVELSTLGSMEFSDTITLCYKDGEMLGVAGTVTTLKIRGESSAVMERTGEMASRLVIEKGKRNSCFYHTPFGDFTIGIFGERIENRLSEDGGTLILSYNIDSNLQTVSKNTVEIEVRKAK